MFRIIDQSIIITEKMSRIIFMIKVNYYLIILTTIIAILVFLIIYFNFFREEKPVYSINDLKSQGYLSADIGIEFNQFNLARLDSGTLFNNEKKFLSSNDLVNKPYLLNFWATWCGPCRAEFDELELLWQETAKLSDLAIVGVNITEDINVVKKFIQEQGSTFEIVLDPDDTLAPQYNVRGIPVTFLIYNDKVMSNSLGRNARKTIINHFNSGKRYKSEMELYGIR